MMWVCSLLGADDVTVLVTQPGTNPASLESQQVRSAASAGAIGLDATGLSGPTVSGALAAMGEPLSDLRRMKPSMPPPPPAAFCTALENTSTWNRSASPASDAKAPSPGEYSLNSPPPEPAAPDGVPSPPCANTKR